MGIRNISQHFRTNLHRFALVSVDIKISFPTEEFRNAFFLDINFSEQLSAGTAAMTS